MKYLGIFFRCSFRLLFIAHVLSSCGSSDEMFTRVDASSSNINFENKLIEKPGLSILDYLYFYNGGGVAVGDIDNDGLPDIYFTANSKSGNRLYLNKGNFRFEDITEKAGVKGLADWCSGVTMVDINGDGYLDIYVSTVNNLYGLTGHNELYINNGNATFSEKSAAYGLNISCTTTQTAFFDYDHDGDLDCYILNQSHHPHANIMDTSNRNSYDSLSGDRLYRNDLHNTGKFTDVSAEAGIYQSKLGYGLGIAVADFNNDGWDDIYIGNDFHENDYYYVNNGNGSFSESGAKHFKHYSRFSMGNDAADYNNDGQLDLITVDMLPEQEKIVKTYGSDENLDIYKVKLENNGYQNQYSKNALQRNNGNGSTFSETALLSGVSATDWSWSPLFADFDNDGNKDLFIGSGIVKRPVDMDYMRFQASLNASIGVGNAGQNNQQALDAMPDGSSHPFFFKGDGKINFDDVSDAWGVGKLKGYFTGAAYADFDNDGNTDMAVNCINDKALLLRNNAAKKTYCDFIFRGDEKNKNGLGAKVYLFSNGKMQYQQVMSTRGFQSSVEPKLHFGLGTETKIDSALVVWTNQRYQLIKELPINKTVLLNQSNATAIFTYDNFFKPVASEMEDITQKIGIAWQHRENTFSDFDKQYLIPHKLSVQGPKIAVADVNGDGLDDFYVCGAAGQAGALMLQNNDRRFVQYANEVFSKNKEAEEVDAVFFDADNDGAKDLYVVSGGNQHNEGSVQLADKLYINDGKGRFTDNSLTAIPRVLKNKSCIAVTDIDRDGDTDIFVGGLADATKYGVPQNSYLMINNGKGIFTMAPQSIINLVSVGIVTSAGFSDTNQDGWDDLIVTGEWMPVKIFLNQKGRFTGSDIAASTGLWQSILIADVEGDGDNDILAGNFGLNTKFFAGKQGPLKIYIKDFDRNGSVEQIITYTIAGKEYSFLAKDELERSLPVLKKAYLKYSDVAGKTVQYMFYELFKEYIELKAEELASCCFINDGKGNFKKIRLPDDLQLAPIYSFVPLFNENTYMAMGNLYGVIPYEGRYDALQPVKFEFDTNGSAGVIKSFHLPVDGEVRAAQWVKSIENERVLVVGRNNRELLFWKWKRVDGRTSPKGAK
jgi:enediyne biosynthesis protein E4